MGALKLSLKEYAEKQRRELIALRRTVEKYESGRAIRELEEKLEAEKKKTNRLKDMNSKLRERNENLEGEVDGLKAKIEELEEMNDKLRAQLNKNSRNSSWSTSHDKPWEKKVQNNREKSGLKPGGQKGHAGHRRKAPSEKPSQVIDLYVPDEEIKKRGLKDTGEVITKRVIGIRLATVVRQYNFHVYKDRNGKKVHAPFPEELGGNEVQYDESVKAFLYYLIMTCNVSIRNARDMLCSLTGGSVAPSVGFIQGLLEEFSLKSIPERESIFNSLVDTSRMHSDFTGARVNGKNCQVLICCDDENALYTLRDAKGFKGINGSPVEFFKGLLYHDHDRTFYNYGSSHQECLVHIRRYLKGVIELESDAQWAKDMINLLDEMTGLDPMLREGKAEGYTKRYMEILEGGLEWYELNPPSKIMRDGVLLCQRMWKYSSDILRFLSDPEIETNNNSAERHLRVFKRKLHQMTTFRSKPGGEDICAGLSVIQTSKSRGHDAYSLIEETFSRPMNEKRRRNRKEADSNSAVGE